MSAQRKPKTAPKVIHEAAEIVLAPAVPKRHRSRWILGDPDADAVEQEVTDHVRKRRGKDAVPSAERKAKDVERFELLAKATVKVPTAPTRKIYVDKRDGSIGEMTARDIADKLLEREAIASETADGVRPKAILCAVCKCVVDVPRVGPFPSKCGRHNRYKMCPRGCGRHVDRRSVSCRECKASDCKERHKKKQSTMMTPERREKVREKRRATAAMMNALMTPERRQVAAKKRQITQEQWSEIGRKSNAAKTPEQRSEAARKANQASRESVRKSLSVRTAEQRSETLRKAWETRRAKKAAAEKAGEE